MEPLWLKRAVPASLHPRGAWACRRGQGRQPELAQVASADRSRQRRQAALTFKDLHGFQATVDLTRPAFRRCEQETFDAAARQGFIAPAINVVKVEPYGDSYVRAYVQDGSSGVERLYFRRDSDHSAGVSVTLVVPSARYPSFRGAHRDR